MSRVPATQGNDFDLVSDLMPNPAEYRIGEGQTTADEVVAIGKRILLHGCEHSQVWETTDSQVLNKPISGSDMKRRKV